MPEPAISPDSTILELTERYPATIRVFVEAGLARVGDPERRRQLGSKLTVKAAASLRQLDLEQLLRRLGEAVEEQRERADATLDGHEEGQLLPEGDVRLAGLLPCPVRLPILEKLGQLALLMLQERSLRLGWSLSAAAVGTDGLNRMIARVQSEDDLPEVLVSAGFETFFDERALRRFRDSGAFLDVSPPEQNGCFGGLQLRDPDRSYTVLAVVPAVFLVNHPILDGIDEPRSWEDLLHPRFRGRVALPVSDFDLFNAILLHIFSRYGEEGVAALAENMLLSLHPSQTAGRFSGKQQAQPAVSVVPLFFGRMTMQSKAITTCWPEDGAVLSPIFMLVKRRTLELARPVADLFLSQEVAELLSHKGRFPALHAQVDNRLPPDTPWQWIGWEFFRQHDVGQLIPRLRAPFINERRRP